MQTKLFSVKEAADFLGVAPSTLYEKASEGKIPFVRLWEGRRKTAIRFAQDALEEHIRKNSIPASPAR